LMSSRVILLTVLLAVWGSGTAAAQRLHGRLIDLVSNEPIPAGILTLLTEDGDPMATVVTDEEGYWVLNAPTPGHYYVEAKRLGYQPWIDGPVTVRRGEDWNAVYHLQPLAIRLDPVQVSAQATARYLELTGFYERQRSSFGHYVEPEDIERRQAGKLTELLTIIPGVRLVSTGGGLSRMRVQLRGSHQSQGGLCRPRVFVDGLIYNRGDSRPFGVNDWGNPELAYDRVANPDLSSTYEEPDIDNIVHPSSIAGIEVYRSGAQVPVRFGGTSIQTRCGVIVIWTKAGQRQRRRR